MMFFYDSTYILIIIGMLLSLAASAFVQSTFNKYSKVRSKSGYTGTEIAQMILQTNNINNVQVRKIAGDLTDNYNPTNQTLNLSQVTADSSSVAAISVAAHECGHAIQHDVNYVPLNFRARLVPVANFGSSISIPLIIAGVFLGQTLINLGIACFAIAFLFQVVTLPVEFNASRRALTILEQSHVLDEQEMVMARKVLTAAALTYVASAISVLLQLLRLFILFGNRRD